MKSLVITAAVNGGGAPKSKTPHQPVTPDTIVAEAIASWKAGAAVVHLHGRLEDGSTTSDVELHLEIVKKIRAAGCDAIMNVSTGDDGGKATHEHRLALVDAGAEIVSLATNSFNSGERIYNNHPKFVGEFSSKVYAAGVRPEIEVLDFGFFDRINGLLRIEALRHPFQFLFGFGLSGGMPPDPRLLSLLIERLPPGSEWGVACPAMKPEICLPITMAAFAQGGHIRTGMEDCPYLFGEKLAASNADLVTQWVETARVWGRPVARPNEARAMLGLKALADTAHH